MVSDFIDEHSGYLKRSPEVLEDARDSDDNFPEEARELFRVWCSKSWVLDWWRSLWLKSREQYELHNSNIPPRCTPLCGFLTKAVAIEPTLRMLSMLTT